MSKYSLLFILVVCALMNVGCGSGASENVNSANNANVSNAPVRANRTASLPDQASLMALEKNAFEAWKNKEASFFEGFLADTFVSFGPGGRLDKAAAIREITSPGCTVNGYSFSDEALTLLGPDAAAVTFKTQVDAACGGQKVPSPMWAAAVYLREGEKWRAVYHNQVPAGGAPPPADGPATSTTGDEAPIDPLTQGLLNMENAAWQARQKKDQRTLEGVAMQDLVYIDAAGTGRHNREQALKLWADAGCKIEGYALTDAQSKPLGSNIAILTYKGTPKGSCSGRPLRPIWGTTTFMKEQGFWRSILVVHSPA